MYKQFYINVILFMVNQQGLMKQHNFKLIIGLGNPGEKYRGTYHNIGSEAIHIMIDKDSANKPFPAQNGCFLDPDQKHPTIYLIPPVYMNESGNAVIETMKRFNITLDKVLIIHDDADIKAGAYKLSYGKSGAGHGGVQSIIRALSTKNFWRLRIGVRGEHAGKAGNFVLQKISAEDKTKIEEALLKIQASYSK